MLDRRIIVAMPAFNEANYIGTMVLKCKQYIPEVLVVDDGSSDQTSLVARLAGARVITKTNGGKGTAIQEILKEAKTINADMLVLLDSDCQHDPDDILKLTNPIIREEADIVIGSREEQSELTPSKRRLGQRILRHSNKVLSNSEVKDTESGFRALSKKAIQSLCLKENGFGVESEMIADATSKGLMIKEVPINNIYHNDGSTLNPWQHGLGVLTRIMIMISERKPLFFFGISGLALLVTGCVIGINVLIDADAGRGLALGSALLAVLLSMVGILCLFVGIILNALRRVIEVVQRS